MRFVICLGREVCFCLIVKYSNCNGFFSFITAQQWCISNGWELIELSKTDDDDSGHEDDFPESWGFQRIRQALHAHTWSNLEMNGMSYSIFWVILSKF